MAWFVTALMLLTSLALPAPLGCAREAEASSLNARIPSVASVSDAPKRAKGIYSGTCGPNLNWSFDSYTGKLTITGSGKMYDYYGDNPWVDGDYSNNPWAEEGFCSEILSVSLPKGITSIGNYAFYGCSALTSITLPSKVKTIGEGAFVMCEGLKSITIPKSVSKINEYAFTVCETLKHVYYKGTAAQRARIQIRYGNDELLDAAWHYSKSTSTALSIRTQPKSITVKEGQVATFKVKTAGAATIHWQYQKPGQSSWNDVGLTASTCSLIASTLFDGYLYRCKVSNGTSELYSSPARLTVKPIQLVIKSNPKTIKVGEGKRVTFQVKTAGATHFQWQIQRPGETDWTDWDVSITDSYSLYAWARYDGCSFRCRASNDRGDTLYSKPAKLYVKIKIKTKPKSVTASEGETASFRVAATGYTDLQWQFRRPGDTVWNDWEGATSDSFSIAALPEHNGLSFRCKVYNHTSCVYTSSAKFTVKTRHYRALLIGENAYPSLPLKGCINDMYAMNGMLSDLKNSFTTKTLPNSTKRQILKAIKSTFSKATKDDVSLFYYSGHGLKYSSSQKYHGALVAIDEQTITFYELANALSKVKGRVIVILDSCFSGSSINKAYGDFEGMQKAYDEAAIRAFSGYYLESAEYDDTNKSGELARSKFVVITASSKTETSHDYYYDGSHLRQGQFTAALIMGMGCTYPYGSYSGNVPADSNNDKKVTLGEIYKYAYDRALEWDASQHAQYYGPVNEVLFQCK